MARAIRNIVVGVDSVHGPQPLLEQAIAFSEALGASLLVVHGFLVSDPLLDAYVQAGYFDQRTIDALQKDLQGALSQQVAELTSNPAVTSRVIAGPVATTIVESAAEVEADLIIVGTSRHTRFPRSLLGNTCRSVLRHSRVPVLMMKTNGVVLPKRILAAVDLSENSRQALDFARSLLTSAAVPEIRALLVIDESLLLLPVEQRLLDRVAAEELAEFLDQSAEAGAEIEATVRRGYPAAEILAEAGAWKAELIAVGTHGRQGMERLLLGSVAEGVMRSAACHVLAVPMTGPESTGEKEAES